MSVAIRRLGLQLGSKAPAYLPGAPPPIAPDEFEQWAIDQSSKAEFENCTLFWTDCELWREAEIRAALGRLRQSHYSVTLVVRQAMARRLAQGFHLELFQGGLIAADDTLLVALDDADDEATEYLERLAGVGKTQFPLVLALPVTPGEAPRHPLLQSRLINARGVGVYLFDPTEGLFAGADISYWPRQQDA